MVHEKGGISWLALERGSPTAARSVVARDYHMSYPFVFRWEDAWYMIPQTGANRTVELWRATDFPEQWELERVLLADVDAVDATALITTVASTCSSIWPYRAPHCATSSASSMRSRRAAPSFHIR